MATLALLGGCSRGKLTPPSLAPRAAETIDPRLPVEHVIVQRPVDAALRARLSVLLSNARAGEAAFRSALGPAAHAASVAGTPHSEGWITAQELLSALEAARAATPKALSDIDALAGETVKASGGIAAADLAAIQASADEAGALNRHQVAEIATLSARIGR